jgi:glucose/arabinose dehydrogenase
MRTLIALAVTAAFAAGAQAQDKPKPPPAWHQGKPAAMGDSKLAPHAGKMTETPAGEIPIDKLKLPKGFKAEIWATGVVGGRAMAVSQDGKKVYMGTRGIGRVYEVTDAGDKRTVRVVVDKLTQPAGVALNGNDLYVFAIDKVLLYKGITASASAQAEDLTAKFDLPKEQHHNWKYVAFGPDKKLYVPFGAPCNICEPPSNEYAQIRRYNADGSGKEVLATGVRNSVGFDWHPKTGELWFTDHGRDWAGDKGFEDELNRIAKPGLNFGFPYCHNNNQADPDIKKAKACDGVTKPVALMGAHTAVMGIKFYTGDMFPAEYKNKAFVVRKGSWNREKPSGFDIVVVDTGAEGKSAKLKTFASGWNESKDAYKFWGRPAYVAQMPDGALLVSDEQVGAVYRISYDKAAAGKSAKK